MDPHANARTIVALTAQSNLDADDRTALIEHISALVGWAASGGGIDSAQAVLTRYLDTDGDSDD